MILYCVVDFFERLLILMCSGLVDFDLWLIFGFVLSYCFEEFVEVALSFCFEKFVEVALSCCFGIFVELVVVDDLHIVLVVDSRIAVEGLQIVIVNLDL